MRKVDVLRERAHRAEVGLIIRSIIELSEKLEELEGHMAQCSDQEHWEVRALAMESIACLQERLAEITSDN